MPRLKHSDLVTLDEAFNTGQGAGYVLEFSDRTYAAFFEDEFNIDIGAERYRANGSSKGKRLRTFLALENGSTAARVLRSLWDERAAILERRGDQETPGLANRYFVIVNRFQGDEGVANTDGIEKFTQSETLDELISAIQRDIQAKKPQAALDRLHNVLYEKIRPPRRGPRWKY